MRFSHLLLGFAALALATAPAARAETASAAVWIVTYFEVTPQTAHQTATLARHYAKASRKANGCAAFDVVEEIGRPGRFAMIAAWRDKASEGAHAAAADAFADKLHSRLISPFDVRPSLGLSVAAPKARPGRRTVFVLTHADIVPTHKDEGQGLVETLAKGARGEHGNLWFDVLQQSNRPNHFTLVEGWANRKAFDAHITAAPTREFRNKVKPLQGALYDERLYRVLR